jgi:LPXTG-site transpeptidase (sortase) family protein
VFRKHGAKILIISGVLLVAAWVGYELISRPWVSGTVEEVNARKLPDPTFPPGVTYTVSTPPPDTQSLLSGGLIASDGAVRLKGSLYSAGYDYDDVWLMPEEKIPLGAMPEGEPDSDGAAFAGDAMIQMFEPPEAEEPAEEETVEIMGTIKIPRLDLSEMIYTGTGKEALKLGIGYVEGSELPNEPCNMVIAAHRSSNNAAPFKYLDQMKVGDFVEVKHWYKTYWYEVFEIIIVDKKDVWVLEDIEDMDYALTMVTCDPYIYFGGNRPRRLIVRAQLKYIDEPVIENGTVTD